MSGTSVFIREAQESSLSPFYHVRAQRKPGICEPGSRSSPDTNCWHLDLGLASFLNWEK